MSKIFQLDNFPKFQNYCYHKLVVDNDARYQYFDDALKREGFTSSQYHVAGDFFMMDELEFTLFALKWS